MTFTRVRDLAGLAVAVGLISWLVIRQVYGALPPFSSLVALSLVVLGAVEVVLGIQLRSRIQRRPGTLRVQPLVAARAVALAKASSLVGAIATGFWSGLLAYTVPRLPYLAAADSDARAAGVGLLSAVVLTAAGLWLEHCCRTPTRPHEDDRG